MKKRTIKVVVAGVIIAVVGVLVFICALGAAGWNIKKISNWQEDTYTTTKALTRLDIKVNAGQVVIKRGSADTVAVKYQHNDVYKTKITESADGKLNITTGEKHWYEFNYWFDDAPLMEIEINENCNPEIYLTVNAGTVEIGDGDWGALIDVDINAGSVSLGKVAAEALKVKMNAGVFDAKRIDCEQFTCHINAGSANVVSLASNGINLHLSAGSANVTVAGQKADYSISVDKQLGSCNVSNQTGTDPQKQIEVKISAGSVNITFAD